jgi:hypothetical protein
LIDIIGNENVDELAREEFGLMLCGPEPFDIPP